MKCHYTEHTHVFYMDYSYYSLYAPISCQWCSLHIKTEDLECFYNWWEEVNYVLSGPLSLEQALEIFLDGNEDALSY